MFKNVTQSRVSDERLAEMIGLGCDQVARHEAYSMARELQSLRSLSSDSVSDGSKEVRIKPLEWVDGCAQTPFGEYSVNHYDDEGGEGWVYSFDDQDRGNFPSENIAKAAAQADFEQRIWSALDGGTGEQQPVAWRWPTGDGAWLYQTEKPVLIDDAVPLYSSPTEPKAGVV